MKAKIIIKENKIRKTPSFLSKGNLVLGDDNSIIYISDENASLEVFSGVCLRKGSDCNEGDYSILWDSQRFIQFSGTINLTI